jgi:SulP family sulfate permease
MPKPEVFIMLIVLILSATWNLVFAVGIGLVIASLMFMKQIGDLTSERSSIVSLEEEKPWDDESDFPVKFKEEVFIKHINGPLFFGSTSDFQQLIKQIPDTVSVIIIRMKKMNYMDQSGLFAMEDALIELIKDGKKVLLVGIQNQPKYMMERVDIIPDLISEDSIFDNYQDCLVWVKANVVDEY